MNKKLGLFIYCVVHLLVDGACCLMLLSPGTGGRVNAANLTTAIILYNTIAFGLQPFFGLFADKIGHTNLFAFFGCIFVGSAALLRAPFATAVMAGLGNAMFHVGGGSFSLNLDREKAVYAGLFVAPGAIGLFLGGLAAKTMVFKSLYAIVPMAISAISVVKIPHLPHSVSKTAKKQSNNITLLPLLLLLLVVTLRAVIGSVGVYPWKISNITGLLMVMTIALGKAAGGFLSDLAGRRNTTAIALILSAPLLAFGQSGILFSLTGLFLFNLTMAVTVTEIADHLKGYSGFSFGLTTLALIMGTYFIYLGWGAIFAKPWVTFLCVVLSAMMMYMSIPADGFKNVQTGGHSHEGKSVQDTF